MTPSYITFSKELDQLKYSDVEDFFHKEQMETDSLEFKSYSGDIQKQELIILENICAMLNSDGGLIIWGTPQERTVHGRKEKLAQGALIPIPIDSRIENGRFYNRIGAEITPLPSGIRFRELENNSQLLYVIEVNKSITSPHQFNKRYYPMRMGANTVAAPHHYIEALFKKVSNPVLSGKIKDVHLSTLFEGISTQFEFQIEIANQSSYINEENLYFVLSHNMEILGKPANGLLVSGKEHATITREDEKNLFVYQARPILFYGDPYKAHIIVEV